tara:strand:+ start:2199 stop:2342 length:144 start_codon:yes stop_codon:yes gene_type:complete
MDIKQEFAINLLVDFMAIDIDLKIVYIKILYFSWGCSSAGRAHRWQR